MSLRHRNKSTIRQVIEDGLESKMTIKDLTFKETMTNSSGEIFVINMYNLYEKYYELLLEHTIIVTLSNEEYLRYRYKPKLLAKDLYGNQDIYYLLLRLNHIYSVINFDFTEMRVFTANITQLLNEIIVLESEDFIENEVAIIKRLNE